MSKLYIVTDPAYSKHLTGPGHPEQPARISSIVETLQSAGIMTDDNTLSPRAATLEELQLCHDPSYCRLVHDEVAALAEQGVIDGSVMLSTGDAQISPDSYDIALLAAGGVLVAIDKVFTEKDARAFCTIRPPGHHAETARGMGFCLFNNVAIGARYAQKKYDLERVAIIDWDVHHGNGTQEIFYEDPSVLYFSTHQYPFYPGTGAATERGVGNILNCPIAGGPGSREKVLQAFQEQLVPAIDSFKPDLIMVSAGFDAHTLDPIGGMDFRDEDFQTLTKIVVDLADKYAQGRIVSVLEGGYKLEALAKAATKHVQAL